MARMKTKTIVRSLILLGVLAAPSSAFAQIDGYRLNIYPQATPPATTPIQSFDFQIGAITCNLAPPAATTTGVPVNPSRAIWDDPANAGRVCQWTDPGTGPLFAVPFGGTYEAGLQAFNAAGRGPESNRAPFSRLAPPSNAPAGLRLIRLGS